MDTISSEGVISKEKISLILVVPPQKVDYTFLNETQLVHGSEEISIARCFARGMLVSRFIQSNY